MIKICCEDLRKVGYPDTNWKKTVLTVTIIMFGLQWICAQSGAAGELVRLDGETTTKLSAIQSANTDTLSKLTNFQSKYSIQSDVFEETEVKFAGNRFIATTRYNNPQKTVWMLAFDGKQYQTFWNGDLWLTHSNKNIVTQLQALWAICPFTTMYAFLNADEAVSGGLVGLSTPNTWIDWIKRVQSLREVRIDGKSFVEAKSKDDYGSKTVLFDSEHNFSPSEVSTFNPQGQPTGTLSVKSWHSFDVGSHRYYVPVSIKGVSYLDDGSKKSYNYEVDPNSIIETAGLKQADFTIASSQAAIIKDLDLNIFLKQNDAFESRSSLAPETK